jgi:cytochrome c
MKKFFIVFSIGVIAFACGSSDEQKADDGKKEDTVAATPTVQNERGLELIGASDCTGCHAIDKKVIGPAYQDVAQKYENSPAVIDTLVNKVRNGGQGNWGTIPMAPHPNLSEEDAREMVKYIMSLKK